jgi:alpha-L-rhamnosidase
MNKISALVVTVTLLLVGIASAQPSGITSERLRCEYRIDPIGVDVLNPRLSWILRTEKLEARNKRQTAYQVLVASSEEKLSRNTGDEWDSGKVASDESIHIQYSGKPLRSNARYFWKVRVWDEGSKVSAWSAPASWTTGLLSKSDWKAQWITDPDIQVSAEAEQEAIRGVKSGYRAQVARTPDMVKWVGVDLGDQLTVEAVRLFPATPHDWQEGSPAIYFPKRFRIETALKADFSDAVTVVDRTTKDEPEPEVGSAAEFTFAPVTARYVRMFATRLRAENEVMASVALAEMEVISAGKNVALGKPVIALDSLEGTGWSKVNLVDGVIQPIRKKLVEQGVTWLRKDFLVAKPIRRATVFATARGVYELSLNGQRVGDAVLAPEWTDYHERSQYQGYDVTKLLRSGKNAIGAVLAAGWYSGKVGLMPVRKIYGTTPELLAHLELEYLDGSHSVVVSDGSWKRSHDGPITSADIYEGEKQDARRELSGWDTAGFDASKWKAAVVAGEIGKEDLTWQRNEPIKMADELTPVKITQLRPSVYIVDFGQNMVGWVRLRVKGKPGTTVRVRHGEMLNEAGELYTANLRDAWQLDEYILRGNQQEVLEPHFTYHGFRFVEITGLESAPGKDAVRGRVFHSSAAEVGQLKTSSDTINQLLSNILWTQRGNFEGIFTDCPQRPERLGWTGDLQSFSQTAIFNMDMAAFLRKFLQDMRDEQRADGNLPDVAPNPMKTRPGVVPGLADDLYGSPAWADASVIIPWRLWVNYGDKRAVEENYESARRWVDYVHNGNPDLLWKNKRGLDPGDWLNGDTLIWEDWPKEGGATPRDVFGSAFFAHSLDLVSRMAAVLGKTEDARKYRELFEESKRVFNSNFVNGDGRIQGDTQGGYALALHFDLLPDTMRKQAVEHMVRGFDRYNGHLSTGFHASHRLMLELTRSGRSDEAYRLLNLTGFPSWRLMIDNGATTIWERWDGYVKGRGFQDPGMNSFNHVAFGSVGEWIWRNVGGINPDEAQPGFKHVFIRPQPGGGLTWANATYDSVRGKIVSNWKIQNNEFVLDVTIPPNTTASVYLPTVKVAAVRMNKPAVEDPKITGVVTDGAVAFEVGSGHYEFVVTKSSEISAVQH